MKIQFLEPTRVIYLKTGGFLGNLSQFDVKEIMPEIFEVKSIKKDKHKQCSEIYLGSDSACDGYSYYLINVPNGLFKQVNDNEPI